LPSELLTDTFSVVSAAALRLEPAIPSATVDMNHISSSSTHSTRHDTHDAPTVATGTSWAATAM
jgi:hypothetical protein